MTQHISSVALVVPDYDAGITFYVDVLGFDLIDDVALSPEKRWVTVAPPGSTETRLLLAKANGHEQMNAIGNQTGGRVGFILSTDDFERDHTRMLAMGIEFEEDPREEDYGTVAIWQDPFGNRWDLFEPA